MNKKHVVKIKFTDKSKDPTHSEYHPRPASQCIPDWYKKTTSHTNNIKNEASLQKTDDYSATIKKCMPVFDAITSGYIIVTNQDLVVKKDAGDGSDWYYWPQETAIEFHFLQQAELHPKNNATESSKSNPIAKWISPWAISTPPGYSSLFIPPMHRDNPITIFEAIIDTDTYKDSPAFPFKLSDPSFSGTIPAGTPVAQVIPFKREVFSMEVSQREEDIKEAKLTLSLVRSTFFNGYKTKFWTKKEYN
jgi:hypothetical protein